jgi:hypothetical protein
MYTLQTILRELFILLSVHALVLVTGCVGGKSVKASKIKNVKRDPCKQEIKSIFRIKSNAA